jgi:hypothetical protein
MVLMDDRTMINRAGHQFGFEVGQVNRLLPPPGALTDADRS